VLLCAVALALGLMGASSAQTVTKAGSGELSKIVVNNAAKAVTVKVYGPGGACSIRQVAVDLTGKKDKKYQIHGTCYQTWVKSIYLGQKQVKCAGFVMTYNKTAKFWRISVPRTCLTQLTSKIKVYSSIMGSSAMPSEAGPTRWIRRG